MRLLLTLAFAVTAQAVIVDGIVATVGKAVITDSMVRRSLRNAAMLAKEPLQESDPIWEANRNRLIEQALVKEEIRISRYPVAQPDEVRAAVDQIKAQFGGPAGFAEKLLEYKLTEADVAENVAWQMTFARFITYRFRPAVQVTDEALRAFYAKWQPPGIKPLFDEARDLVEVEYIAEESSRYLDNWLKETRQSTRIETMQRKSARP